MNARERSQELLGQGLDKIPEVARFLKISTSQVYALMNQGQLPSVKLGRSRRIPHGAVLDLAARNLVGDGDGGTEVKPCCPDDRPAREKGAKQ
jgi:excisionase family DNA binding protein